MAPYQVGHGGGQRKQDTLGNESELHVAMIRGHLSSDGVAVWRGCPMQMLVARIAFDGLVPPENSVRIDFKQLTSIALLPEIG